MDIEAKTNKNDLRLGIFQLLVGATIISFSPVFVKLADIGPTVAGFYRMAFGTALLLAIVIVRRETLWKGARQFWPAFACGVFFALDLGFWHRSIELIGPGLSTIMGNFQVFFLAAFGILVYREKIDWKFVVSVPLAIVGLMLIVGVDWTQLETGYKLGILFGLITALTYAAYVIVLQKGQSQPGRLSAAANLCVISIVTAVLMGGESIILGESFRFPDNRSLWSMIGYGFICQALGWIIISRALVKVEASRAGLILLLQPTLAFVWDVVFFSRQTDIIDAVGATLALAAIYLGGTRARK